MITLARRLFLKTGDIFERSAVEKSQFIYLTSCQIAFLLTVMLFALEHFELLPDHDLDARGVIQLLSLTSFYTIVAFLLYLIGFKVGRNTPDSSWYSHLCIQLYCVANVIILYYLGLFSLGTGVALAGGPIAGMILFRTPIIVAGMTTGISAAIVLIVLTALNVIPYAPLVIDREELHTNLAWLFLQATMVVPHVVLLVSVAAVSIVRWREREDKVRYLSCTDVLTEVSNRRHLMDRFDIELDRAVRNKAPLSFMMLDLDHFKQINDTYGHQVGDVVIQTAAQVLKTTTRKVDLVGRYGGEEFAVILPNTDEEGARQIAERCRHAMEQSMPRNSDGTTIRITASIGVSSLKPGSSDSIDNLLKLADQALYQAKESGRNQVVTAQT